MSFGDGLQDESGWRHCDKCQLLFFNGTPSLCPAGGSHQIGQSAEFHLPMLPQTSPGWSPGMWARCKACQSLVNTGQDGALGNCPHGSCHDVADDLYKEIPDSPPSGAIPAAPLNVVPQRVPDSLNWKGIPKDALITGGWFWCSKCQGLAFGVQGAGVCGVQQNHAFPGHEPLGPGNKLFCLVYTIPPDVPPTEQCPGTSGSSCFPSTEF
jgi:hypothetical protein